jgi:hypothetical protein
MNELMNLASHHMTKCAAEADVAEAEPAPLSALPLARRIRRLAETRQGYALPDQDLLAAGLGSLRIRRCRKAWHY